MNERTCRAVITVLLSLGLFSTAVGQGLHWESTISREGVEDTNAVTEVEYLDGSFKLVPADGEPTLIVHCSDKSVVVVNQMARTYTVMTFAEWSSVVGERKPSMFAVPPSVQNLPPEERKRVMDEMYKNAPFQKTPVIETVKTTETKTICGFPCVKYIVKQDREEIGAHWITTQLKELSLIQGDLLEFYRQVAIKGTEVERGMAKGLALIGGFPMRTDVGDDESTVKVFQRRNLQEEDFEAPSGYRRATPQLGG